MTSKEKILYHQIHPLKLSVDIFTGIATTYLAWQHNIIWFLILFLIPSVIATIVLTSFANLEPLKNSALGKYIEKYMPPAIQAVRFAGQIVMWVAAWYHLPVLIAVGALVIVIGWCNGLVFKKG